jgi:heparan-alpha-glucosaminide N-acetyltransferase
MTAAPAIRPPDPVPQLRNVSVDAYRGFVMFLMMAEVLRLSRVAQALPGNPFWQFLAWNQTHVAWAGASLHDLIQPSFSFLVGVALPYSIASRLAKGATIGRMVLHAAWRALVLIALGIFLRSTRSAQTNFTFEDTLTQIGLGYTFLFLLGLKPPRWSWIALGVILFGYWLAWALFPIAPGLPFEAHWAKNANAGHAFDVWFLNLFPREKPFIENRGGYLTLIPTLGTMILGLVAGRWLRASAPAIPYRKFLVAGAIGVTAGAVLHFAGICPVVKRIWTPSWTLFSGGLCFLLLALFCRMRPAHFLVVVGMNSIAAYLIAHLFHEFIEQSFRIHLGQAPFTLFGPAYQPLLLGAAVLATYWLILWWMYRRKLFLKI